MTALSIVVVRVAQVLLQPCSVALAIGESVLGVYLM